MEGFPKADFLDLANLTEVNKILLFLFIMLLLQTSLEAIIVASIILVTGFLISKSLSYIIFNIEVNGTVILLKFWMNFL